MADDNFADSYFAGDARTHRSRMLAGDMYIGGLDTQSNDESRRAERLLFRYTQVFSEEGEPAARPLLAEVLGHLADGAYVKPTLTVSYGFNISVGARTFLNSHCVLLDDAAITIGEDVAIGPLSQLVTPVHPINPQLRRAHIERALPIVVGDNVWIGAAALILPGVTVGENSVVGAGAVVTKDVPANCVVIGNPARVAKTF